MILMVIKVFPTAVLRGFSKLVNNGQDVQLSVWRMRPMDKPCLCGAKSSSFRMRSLPNGTMLNIQEHYGRVR